MSGRRAEVDLAPLREAFGRSGLSNCEMARRLGVHESWVRRKLGGASFYSYRTYGGNSRRYVRQWLGVSRGRAVQVVAALGLDPVDFDL